MVTYDSPDHAGRSDTGEPEMEWWSSAVDQLPAELPARTAQRIGDLVLLDLPALGRALSALTARDASATMYILTQRIAAVVDECAVFCERRRTEGS